MNYFNYFNNQIKEYKKLKLEPMLILENLFAEDVMVEAFLSMESDKFAAMLDLLRVRVFK